MSSQQLGSRLILNHWLGSAVFGRIIVGHLSDKVNPWTLAASTTLCTSVVTFTLWGVLSRNFAGVLAFGIAYGALAGGWSSHWVGFIKPIAREFSQYRFSTDPFIWFQAAIRSYRPLLWAYI